MKPSATDASRGAEGGSTMGAMHRDPHSHKGENGKVCIIGGSRHMHGAPVFSALAAEASGADLFYLFVPAAHEEVAKAASLNFQVRTFSGNELAGVDVQEILQLLASMDCAVIGPGLSREASSLEAMRSIIAAATCPLVLDASALQPETIGWVRGKPVVLTPHLGELERMKIDYEELAQTAKDAGVTILLKAPTDLIAGADGEIREVEGGNAGMSVGGTGDALAGLTAGLIAQKMTPLDAAILASKTLKKAGDMLRDRQGYAYTAQQVITMIPIALREALHD